MAHADDCAGPTSLRQPPALQLNPRSHCVRGALLLFPWRFGYGHVPHESRHCPMPPSLPCGNGAFETGRSVNSHPRSAESARTVAKAATCAPQQHIRSARREKYATTFAAATLLAPHNTTTQHNTAQQHNTHHHERRVLLALPFLRPGAARRVQVLALVRVGRNLHPLHESRSETNTGSKLGRELGCEGGEISLRASSPARRLRIIQN